MLVLFAILVFLYNFALTFYVLSGVEPSPTIEFLYGVAFLCGAIWWLRDEPGKSGMQRVYCHGMLMNVGWFVLIPYHLFKTRGWKGLLPVVALIATYVLSLVMGAIVYAVFSGGPIG